MISGFLGLVETLIYGFNILEYPIDKPKTCRNLIYGFDILEYPIDIPKYLITYNV